MGAVNPIESLNGARARTLDTNTFWTRPQHFMLIQTPDLVMGTRIKSLSALNCMSPFSCVSQTFYLNLNPYSGEKKKYWQTSGSYN